MAEVFRLDITKTVKEVAERALDEYTYQGLTIKQWADKIMAGEYQPVKHGRWRKRMSTPDSLKCSVCGNNHERPTTYCPNCGAKMDGESE